MLHWHRQSIIKLFARPHTHSLTLTHAIDGELGLLTAKIDPVRVD